MLLAFDFRNHLSFRETASLSTLRTGKPKELDLECSWDERISPVTVIYGPNASGKSNLLGAFGFVRALVTTAHKGEESQPKRFGAPFALDETSKDTQSEFEVRFIANYGEMRYEYVYRLILARAYIAEESLTVYRSVQPTTLYVRTQEAEDIAPAYWFNRVFAQAERAIIQKATLPYKPALAAAPLMDTSPLQGAFEWFSENISLYNAAGFESEHESIKERLHNGDESLRKDLLSYLQEADLGICSIELNEIREEDETRMRAALSEANIPEDLIERFLADERLSLSLGHSTAAGIVTLPFGHESEGTKAMLSFGSVASKTLRSGSILVIDEIDTSLHPALVRHLVKRFADPTLNPKQAQLIITTHDLGLLTTWPMEDDLLSRDQVWFVEKDRTGASSLYSLADFSPRKGDNILRRYLMGHYGAVPKVGNHER